MTELRMFTIGFTHKSAAEFFETLRKAGVKRVVDIRLNNTSQLAGFAKKDDLAYFLRGLAGIDYLHLPELAPSEELLDAFKKQKGPWDAFERGFLALLKSRKVEAKLARETFADACLLCSEPTPDHCHRRLVAEHLASRWNSVEIVHL